MAGGILHYTPFCTIRIGYLVPVLFFYSGGELANFKDFIELKSIAKDRRFLQLVRKKMVMIKELLEIDLVENMEIMRRMEDIERNQIELLEFKNYMLSTRDAL